MDNRPPLGPNAKKHLTIFALFTVLKIAGTVLFAGVLGTVLAHMARQTFAALHEGQVFSHPVAEQLAVFSGNAQAQIEGIWLVTLGHQPTMLSLTLAGLLAMILRSCAEWALSYSAQRAATGAKSTLRAQLIERVLATGGKDTPEGTGANAVLISRGLDDVDDYYSKTLTAMVSSVITPILLLIVVGWYDWISAVVLAVTLPLIPLFMVLIGKTTQADTAKSQQELLRLSDHIVELVKGLPVLVGLGRAHSQSKALADLGERYRKTTMKTLRSAFLSSFWLELITTISVAVVAVMIGIRLVHGSIGLDVALFALLLAPEYYQPLRNLGAAFHQSEEGIAALRKAEEIIQRPLPQDIIEVEGSELNVSRVSVTYPGRSTVLSEVSFTLPHGSTTAVTGPSGCGKSTLLGVLSGAVAPGLIPTGAQEPMHVEGSVSGIGSIVWVSQSPAFIATTVLHEVALYGFPAIVTSEEEFQAAQALITDASPMAISDKGRHRYLQYLRIVGLEEFADLTPESLSAGQMRRLAIARTMARVDALERIGETVTVLVDEPTAHLDDVAAARVNASLAALAATGATLLIVTHDEELAERTDYHLAATVDTADDIATWNLLPGSGKGWDLEKLRQQVNEQPIPEATKSTKQRKLQQPIRSGTMSTLKDIKALTGIRVRDSIAPILLSALSVCFAVALTALSGWLIMRAAEQPAMMYLMVAIVGVRFFGLGRACLRYIERLQTHNVVLRAANKLRVRAWDSAGRTVLSIRSLLRGDRILDRLVGDIDELRDDLPRVLLPVGSHIVVMVLAVTVTIFTVPLALPAIVAGAIMSTLVIPAIVIYTDHRASSTAREATSEMLRLGVSTLDAAEELRANGLNYLATAVFKESDQRNVDATVEGSGASGFGQALTILNWWGVSLVTVVLTWAQVREGHVTAPVVAVVVLMCTALVESTLAHVEAVRGWPAMAELVARMRPLIEANRWTEAQQQQRTEEIRAKFQAPIHLELSNVATRWPGMRSPVFTGLNAEVSSGEWLGITGASGSGKTTALATLLGFLPIEAGLITVNDISLSDVDLRGYAAWCPQSAYIFESSIANNLALAAPGEKRPSEEEMLHALDRVGLGDFVRKLPEGLNTQVGAGGSYVSGGQRQRIAIARTLLTESPLLLMDEPTAHLDTPAAKALIAEVARGTKESEVLAGRDKHLKPAVILVSHRVEDIAECDRTVSLS